MAESTEDVSEDDARTWWDWVWRESPDSYCGARSELTVAERKELLAIRGMIPVWSSARGPNESRWYRCPLTPEHDGRHATPVGSIDSDFLESVWEESDDHGYYLSNWYLTWGPESDAPRSIGALAPCFGETPDAEGTLWRCRLMAKHSGSCRKSVLAAVDGDDEEY